MEARELRIGNYYKANMDFPKGSLSVKINVSKEKRVFQLTEHIARTLFISYNTPYGGLNLLNLIEPIPLTKEWFDKDKFNFEKTDLKYHIGELEEMPFIINDESGLYYYNMVSPEIKIKYVHKLQNLYHALRSKELTIKETV